jgi:23S rRNA (guanosine2251-2'-O)-methyltransferase
MRSDLALLFGVNAVVEMLKTAPSEIVEVLLSENSDRAVLRAIGRESARRHVPVTYVDSSKLDVLVPGQRHQGVVARAKTYHYVPFTELLQRASVPGASERILLLDGVTDPRNLGALIRSAAAAGVRFVVIPRDRAADVTPIVAKAAAGATSHVGISRVTNLRRAIRELKSVGFWIVGLDMNSRETIYDRKFPAKLTIVLGSEGRGIRPINLRECDFVVSIPMAGAISSLNVSVAGAIFLFELLRQARLGPEVSDDSQGGVLRRKSP